jgi:hypothetical protein
MNELLSKSEELRTQRFVQNSEIVKNNILALVKTSLVSSKLSNFEPVIEKLTQKITVEFENQKQVHLASFQGIARTFFENLVTTLRAANKFCNGQYKDCYSDLGAFLSEELIREEEEEVDQEDSSLPEEQVQETPAEVQTQEDSQDEGGLENVQTENVETLSSEEAPQDQQEISGDSEKNEGGVESPNSSSEESVKESTEQTLDNTGKKDIDEKPLETEETSIPVTNPSKTVAAAFRNSKRISKALFEEAVKVYQKNIEQSYTPKSRQITNMVVVPIN